MNNPYTKPKNYLHYSGEKFYNEHRWVDMDGLSLVEGCYLIICTIQITTGYHANVGFRLVDGSNTPLIPTRKSTNNRVPAHFSAEPNVGGAEDQTPVTFHMVAYCNVVKLQIRVNDAGGRFKINTAGTHLTNPPPDSPWNHKPISTMSAIPLCPTYQPGANKVFSYPKSRISPRGEQPSKPNVS
jgi:hypothetical protein